MDIRFEIVKDQKFDDITNVKFVLPCGSEGSFYHILDAVLNSRFVSYPCRACKYHKFNNNCQGFDEYTILAYYLSSKKKGVDRMKIKREDITKKEIWNIARVRSIPLGWKREVWYDPENEVLYGVLLSRGEIYAPKDHIYIDTFVSLGEFWTNYPYTACDLNLNIEDDGLPSDEDIEEIYRETWYEEFEYPENL
jgi:hypothetical protein